MATLITTAYAEIDDTQTTIMPYRNATAACEDAFKPLSKLTTRVMKAVKASGAPDSFHEDALTYSRKIKVLFSTQSRKERKEQNPPTLFVKFRMH